MDEGHLPVLLDEVIAMLEAMQASSDCAPA